MSLILLLQSRRNANAAKRFLARLLGNYELIGVIVTDQLSSYPKATKDLMPKVQYRRYKWLNNQIEVSHQSVRLFKRAKRKFKTPSANMQLFLSLQRQLRNLFAITGHSLTRQDHKIKRAQAFNIRHDIDSIKGNLRLNFTSPAFFCSIFSILTSQYH